MIRTIEPRDTQDPNWWRRNLRAPRSGESAAQYAQAIHHEQVEESHRWAERVMLVLVGAFVAAVIRIPSM